MAQQTVTSSQTDPLLFYLYAWDKACHLFFRLFCLFVPPELFSVDSSQDTELSTSVDALKYHILQVPTVGKLSAKGASATYALTNGATITDVAMIYTPAVNGGV